jgi:hypothetical protein
VIVAPSGIPRDSTTIPRPDRCARVGQAQDEEALPPGKDPFWVEDPISIPLEPPHPGVSTLSEPRSEPIGRPGGPERGDPSQIEADLTGEFDGRGGAIHWSIILPPLGWDNHPGGAPKNRPGWVRGLPKSAWSPLPVRVCAVSQTGSRDG